MANLRLHQFITASLANGPGCRAVIWTQGCTLACVGCFNEATHSFNTGTQVDVHQLVGQIKALDGSIEGVTISGGEPFQQLRALDDLLTAIRAETALSILLFTGFEWSEILKSGELIRLAKLTDVLIAGRYKPSEGSQRGLATLPNKTTHFFTERYSIGDLEKVPEGEIIIDTTGAIISTGVVPCIHIAI